MRHAANICTTIGVAIILIGLFCTAIPLKGIEVKPASFGLPMEMVSDEVRATVNLGHTILHSVDAGSTIQIADKTGTFVRTKVGSITMRRNPAGECVVVVTFENQPEWIPGWNIVSIERSSSTYVGWKGVIVGTSQVGKGEMSATDDLHIVY